MRGVPTLVCLGLLLPGFVSAQEASPWSTPEGVARAFQKACLLTSGNADQAVDWALSQGFEPVDALRGNMDGLLSGQPGCVLAAPGTEGHVLLVATQGRHCTVWADNLQGPALRSAVAEVMGMQAAKGARVSQQVDRSIERAGAWRHQTQWRYRDVGKTQDLGVGAVTTLSGAPGTQALHLEPVPTQPALAPDGLLTR